MAAQYPLGGQPPSVVATGISPSFKESPTPVTNTNHNVSFDRTRKRFKGPAPMLDHLLPDEPRYVREKLFWEIYALRNSPDCPEDVNIHVIKRPDGEYKALYIHKTSSVLEKRIKKQKKTNSLREALRANRLEIMKSKDKASSGGRDDSDNEYFDDVDEMYGDAELMATDFPNPTPSGRITLADGCNCPCGCSNNETPARSHRLDLTNKKPVCNKCGINQLRNKAECWGNQHESIKNKSAKQHTAEFHYSEEAAIVTE
jgi:hypothetical protein